MPGAHERLSQPAGREAAVHRGRVLRHRRRLSPRRRRLSLFHRPQRRHVRLGRREHLPGRCRAHARTPSRRRAGRRRSDRRRHQGAKAGRLRGIEARTQAERGRDQALCACQRPRLRASALRLVRRRIAACVDQQGRSGAAARSRAGARNSIGSALAKLEREGSVTDRQLPILEEIFLDHVGHFVRDPQSASRALARAGFAPPPVSIQVAPDPDGTPRPTGTGNVTAMFTRGYIEVLFKPADTPLSRELEAARARYPGVHLAAFTVADAAASHRRLAERGFRVRPLVHMQRPVETGGPPGTAAFTLARGGPGEMAGGGTHILTPRPPALVRQPPRTEALVWQPRWPSHPNGALALASIVIAVADVEEAARRFARFTDREAKPSPLGPTIGLDRGCVQLVTADAFARKLPEVAIPS